MIYSYFFHFLDIFANLYQKNEKYKIIHVLNMLKLYLSLPIFKNFFTRSLFLSE